MTTYHNSPFCTKCGSPLWDDGQSTAPQQTCECYIVSAQLTGWIWICPVCGAGLSSSVSIYPNQHYCVKTNSSTLGETK